MHCPINEQTGDGHVVGRCWYHLPDGKTCPRHGDVSLEVEWFMATGYTTLESVMRTRREMKLLVRESEASNG